MPGNLVVSLDCGFLLLVAPWSFPNKVTDHNKVWEGQASLHPRVLGRMLLNEGGLLFGHCLAQSTTKTLAGAKGKVEEDYIPRGIQALARFHFYRHCTLNLSLCGHLQGCLFQKRSRVPVAPEVK